MNNVEEFFDKLNNKMKYLDPYKWLLDVEPEHITETIKELKCDLSDLQHAYDQLGEYPTYYKRLEKSINYKKECITILENLKEDYENEQQTN